MCLESPAQGELGRPLGVVTGRDQQVCEHEQLVVSEALPMSLPVVMVSASELRQGLLHRHLIGRSPNIHKFQTPINT